MSDKLPPVDGVEYPEKPDEDASMMKKMKYLEQVEYYWTVRGSQKINSEESVKDEEDATDDADDNFE